MSFELNSGLFTILRPCQHNKGYKDDQSQIQVHWAIFGRHHKPDM